MPITASRTARFRKLADDLDAALARGDEVGMDLLKSMLPELCEAIEEINEALREIDSLLFEGLRDEAIGLHDPELGTIALRLHLEDKPQWPAAALFFESEGIKPPPAIDFVALSSLNSAHAELDRLRKPLDRLRRLALGRAPLQRKISLLRKLRKHDPSKPVWGERLTAHEEVRVLELNEAVKKAFANRDPDAIAALHQELSDPDWSVPVPTRLTRDTSGGHIWARLRRTFATLEGTALRLESDFSTRDDDGTDLFDRVEQLRFVRQQWLNGESQCREWLFSLPQYTAIVGLAHSEDFGQRLETLRQKVAPALEWLADLDERDYLIDQFREACSELELLTEKHPRKKEEAQWLARIDKLDNDLQRICQQLPQLTVPESLPLKIDRAVADIRRRGLQRSRNRVVGSVLGVLVVAGVLGITAYVVSGQRARLEACKYAESLLPLAQKGEYVVRPELLDTYAAKYGTNAVFGTLLEKFDTLAANEQARRNTFDGLLAEHDAQLGRAHKALAERADKQELRLAEWPSAVFDAADKHRSARLKGGFPKKRKIGDGSSNDTGTGGADVPPAVRQRFDEEETRLAEHADKQDRVERSYSNAAVDEFVRRLKEIEAAIPAADAPGAGQAAKDLLLKIEALLDEARRPRSSSVESSKRIPYSTLESAQPIKKRLETVVHTAS